MRDSRNLHLVKSTHDAEMHGAWMRAVAEHADTAAFGRLFEFYAPRVKTYLLRLGSTPAEAEELAQDAMVTVWQRAVAFDAARGGVSTWIFTVARNRRIDLLRSRGWNPAAALDIEDIESALPDPDSNLEDRMAGQSVARRALDCLEELPEAQQEALRLAFLEERTHVQIAAELGVPLGTIKTRIRSALQRLQDLLAH